MAADYDTCVSSGWAKVPQRVSGDPRAR